MKNRGFAPVLIIIVVAILGIAGYFVYQNYLAPKGTILGPYIPSPSPIDTTVTTASWKTYTNPKFGFEIQYPPDAKTSNRSPLEIQIDNFQPNIKVHGFPIGWMVIVSEPQQIKSGESLSQWAKEKGLISDQLINQENQTKVIDTKIDGQPAIYWRSTGGDADQLFYLVKNNNNVVLITINPATGYENVINKILSTFKFLGQNSVSTPQPVQGQFCGGIAGTVCPEGFTCKYDGSYPDASGHCVKQ